MKEDFFHVVSVSDFQALLSDFPPLGRKELVSLGDACGRILAENVYSREHLPPFSRSCMDGYAVISSDTFGASENSPVYLDILEEIAIDRFPSLELDIGQCSGLFTGSPLPGGANAVVMQEHTRCLGGSVLEISRAVAPGENTLYKGEDCLPGNVALEAPARLDAPQTGLLAALGICEVAVFSRPLVGIVSTGDELVPHHRIPAQAQIRDVNTHALSCLLSRAGAIPVSYGICGDATQELSPVLLQASRECDLVLVSGGSSVGNKDVTLQALEDLPEFELLAHGVSISPGKPTILARSGALPLVGLPGQVTSAQVVMQVLLLPFIRQLQGMPFSGVDEASGLTARLSRNISSKQGREDYVRVRLRQEEGELLAEPILGPSGLLKTLLQADALLRIPENVEGLSKGRAAQVIPLREESRP